MTPPNPGGSGHVITLYGAKYGDDGDILGVYVHENNKKNGEIIYMELERELLTYDFENDKTGVTESGEYIRLKLNGEGATANGWYIGNAANLNLRIMPEPATTTLSLLGLSLLLTRRSRRSC